MVAVSARSEEEPEAGFAGREARIQTKSRFGEGGGSRGEPWVLPASTSAGVSDRSLRAGTILARTVQTRLMAVLLPVAVALAAAGCGNSTAKKATPTAAAAPLKCPAAWAAGWQQLAKRIDAPVYCPTWLPQPLDGKIGGDYAQPPYMGAHHAYLVSFLYFDKGESLSETHVNFRGYPGRTAIPVCQDTIISGKRTLRPNIPCFADPHGHVRFGNTMATVYTANQGIDTWHVLVAWHHDGSLYTLSQHVAPPFTYAKVVQDLGRMLRGLVLVRP